MLDSAPDVAYNAIQMDGKRVPALTAGFLELSPNSQSAADGEPAKGGYSIRNSRELGDTNKWLGYILV